ncbi:hypothetical protein CPB86DRAFT_800443 [Serendipita vermifera]|nr:hypothetical protein CPB86DRAFT_800443 [Serendipita vermifera]
MKLNKYKVQFSESEKATANLKFMILTTGNDIRIQKVNLEDMKRVLDRLWKLDRVERLDLQDELTTCRLNSIVVEEVSQANFKAIKSIELEIANIEKHIRRLQERYMEFETLSRSWMWKKDFARTNLTSVEATLVKIYSESASLRLHLKILNSPIWKIPREVWLAIFELCQEVDFDEYQIYTRPSHPPFRSNSVEAAAATCRLWRDIILGEPSLRNIIYVHPSRYMPKNNHEMIIDRLNRSQGASKLIFVSNLSRIIPSYWNEANVSQDLPPDDKEIPSINEPQEAYPLNDATPFNDASPPKNANPPKKPKSRNYHINPSRSFSVHLVMYGDSDPAPKNASNFPFYETEDLSIHIQTSKSTNRLKEIISHFPETKSLYLRCFGLHFVPLRDLESICPSLSSLTLSTENMPDFDLTPLLNNNLTELSIYHNGQNSIGRLANRIQLPMLKLLEVPYPSSEFLECLDLPNLERISLYGPHSRRAHSEYGPIAIEAFQNIARIQLRGFMNSFISTTPNDGIYEARRAHVQVTIRLVFVR